MSTLARETLPYLAERHDIIYVTGGDEIPDANFARGGRGKRRRHMNVAGFGLSIQVNRLYREGSIDLALVWASIGFALGRAPFIHFVGGSVYAEIRQSASKARWHRRVKFLTGLAHFALPEAVCHARAARIVAPSQALKNDLVRLHRLPQDKISVVPHGTEPRHLALYAQKPAGLPAKILYTGRLHPSKGMLAVLQAFIRRPDIDAEFLILGDGPQRETLQRLAARDARVKLLGHVGQADLETALRRTNIFVFPSFYEGFGLALVEAMASGHACVCYDIPAVREVLGGTGVLVPPGDAAGLVEEVARLAKDAGWIETCSARAYRRAGRFSWQDAREEIDFIIRETAAGLGLPRASVSRLRAERSGRHRNG